MPDSAAPALDASTRLAIIARLILPDDRRHSKALKVELENKNFAIDTAADYHGVFFKSVTGVIVEASDYGFIKGQLIVCTVPAGLTLAQEIMVTGSINGALRTGIYPIPLLL